MFFVKLYVTPNLGVNALKVSFASFDEKWLFNILLDDNELVSTEKTNNVNEIIGINTFEQLQSASNV